MNEILATLQDPSVAFLLLVVGALFLAAELSHPTLLVGLAGAAALVLAAVGLAGLPVNWLGLGVLAGGLALLVVETQVASHGLLALGGAVLVALGAMSLYTARPGGDVPLTVAPPVIALTSVGAGLAALGVGVVAARVRAMPAPRGGVGTRVAPGTAGVVEAPLEPLGTVYLAGETWTARTADGARLPRDARVQLVAVDGLTAIVEPLAPDGASQPAASPAGHRP